MCIDLQKTNHKANSPECQVIMSNMHVIKLDMAHQLFMIILE